MKGLRLGSSCWGFAAEAWEVFFWSSGDATKQCRYEKNGFFSCLSEPKLSMPKVLMLLLVVVAVSSTTVPVRTNFPISVITVLSATIVKVPSPSF